MTIMGYTISIGEAQLHLEEFDVIVLVKEEKHDNAPADGVPTDFTNSRWPSYSAWSEFAKEVNLYDMFYCKEKGLMRDSYIAVPLNQSHKEKVDFAFKKFSKRFELMNTDIFLEHSMYTKKDIETTFQYYLDRLKWLKYWVDWSLENCENPIMKTS